MEDLIGDLTSVPQPIEIKIFSDDEATLQKLAPQDLQDQENQFVLARDQPNAANRHDDICGNPSVAAAGARYWSGFIYVETTRYRDHIRPRISAAAGFDSASVSPRALSP